MIDLRLQRYPQTIASAIICLTCGIHLVDAAEVDVEFRLGATYSDNARREELNETSDTIATAGLWLDMSEVTKRFDGSLRVNIDHNAYSDGSFDDETFASFAGNAEMQVVPRVFSWVVADNFGKLRTDPFQADTPENREDVNRFSTGPILRLRFGPATALELTGQYKNTRFEVSDFNNDVLGGKISLIRALSEVRSISLNATVDRIEFDDSDNNSNFDLISAYLALQSRISRSELSASIGVNQIHDNGTTSSGLLADISWSREISSSSTVSIDYQQKFSEAGDLFESLQNIEKGSVNSLPILGSTDSLELSRVSAAYRFARQRNGLNLSFTLSQLDYEVDDFLDRDMSALRFDVQRQLGPAWHVRIGARALRTEYNQIDREDDDLELSLNIRLQLTRTLGVDIAARHIERDSNLIEFNYDENRYTLQIAYSPWAR